jgi:5-(carboxyamino)imidazole ribonucleotide synthase
MKHPYTMPGLTLGILGGGQLGRMMCIEARRMGITTICLDPSPNPPAKGVADLCIQGDLYDPVKIQELAEKAQVLTFEIEHVNTGYLQTLETQGFTIYPSPKSLQVIQDKFVQKTLFAQANLPVPPFARTYKELNLPFPLVQKTRTGGYDGRGVSILADETQVATKGLEGETFFEELVDFDLEIAVLLARSPSGETAVWPVVEMVFDPATQICTKVCAPARIPAEIEQEAIRVSIGAVQVLDGVGVFAVELFVSNSNSNGAPRVLINEVAPRPHNSGHWTIEGSLTSQFAQHLRAVCGLPLGSTDLTMPSVMINLLGEPGAQGKPTIQGYEQALAIPGLSFHWYEKSLVSTQRKMGHVTVTRPNLEDALRLADQAQNLLTITGEPL